MTIDPNAVEAACKAYDDCDETISLSHPVHMSAALAAAAPFIRAEIAKDVLAFLPAGIRAWNKKREFYGPDDPATYAERERKALDELRQAGDATQIIINEGDWIGLELAVQMLRALAPGPASEGEKP